MKIQEVKISEVKANPNNPRICKDDKFRKLVESIKSFPEMLKLRPIVVNDDMIVLGGNMRLKACKEAGLKMVPIIRAEDLTEDQQREFIIKDNVGFGDWDWEELANNWEAEKLDEWGLDVPDFKVEPEAEEDDYEVPETITTDIVPGDLFEIGDHRLLCGNCTHTESINKLMNGQFADTIITDPPYSSGGFQESAKTVGSIGTRDNKHIALDNLSTTGYKGLIKEFLPLHPKADSVYIFTDWKMWQHTLEVVEISGLRVRSMLVWDKEQMGMGMPWRNQHELICYAKKTSGKINSGKYGNVLKSKRSGNILHPTQKPIDIIDPLIKNTDCKLIFEPFCGSGTTMVTAHQNNKICYATELSPDFCQVIVDRMRKLDPALVIKRNGETI